MKIKWQEENSNNPINLSITCDDECLEFNIFGSSLGLRELGLALKNLNETKKIKLDLQNNDFYPVSFIDLVLIFDEFDTSGRIKIIPNIPENEFILSGNREACDILWSSIFSFSKWKREINDHFHIDFINEILSNDKISVIIGIDK